MRGKIKHAKRSHRGLIYREGNLQPSKRMRSIRTHRRITFGAAPIFVMAFSVAFLSSSILAPTNSSDAVGPDANNNTTNGYFVALNTPDVSMDLKTNPAGTMTVVSSTTKAATNSPNGYELYVGISPTNLNGTTKSVADQQKNGLYLQGDLSRTDGEVFAAVNGTSTTPTALTDNTWGYAVDKNSIGAPTIWTTEEHSTMTSATPTNDKFAAVPTVGNEELIQQTDTGNVPASTPIEDLQDSDYTEANLYYGIRGTPARANGIYSNTIAYTIVTKYVPTGSISLSPASYARSTTYEQMTWDDTLTITTPIYTSSDNFGSATVTLSGGPEGDTDLVCSNPTLSTVNQQLIVSCTLPAAYAGNYKLTLSLDKYGQTYTSDYTYTASWDTISAMQEMTPTICAEPTTPSTSATTVPEKFLTDLRGGGGHINPTTGEYQEAYTGKYRIRKLADGNCWMTENMDLPIGESTTFYSYDTNLTAIPDSSITESGTYGTYTNTDNIISWTPKNVVDTATCTTGAAHCSPNTTGPATSDSWCYNNNDGPIDTNVKNAHNYQGPGCTHGEPGAPGSLTENRYVDDNDGKRQGIGAYYNWAASTAQSGGNNENGDAVNSICPKGWRLPSGGDSSTAKSFATLTSTYGYTDDATGSAAARKFPLSLVYSGTYHWDGYLNNQGYNGNWWSSSPYTSSTRAYNLYMNSSYLFPQDSSVKAHGFALRCVSL